MPHQPFANSTTSVSDQHRMAAISTAVMVHAAVPGDGDCAGVIVSLISDTIHAWLVCCEALVQFAVESSSTFARPRQPCALENRRTSSTSMWVVGVVGGSDGAADSKVALHCEMICIEVFCLFGRSIVDIITWTIFECCQKGKELLTKNLANIV